MTVMLERVSGASITPWLDEIARLRMTVFREFPYLYDGDEAYEREYLTTYADSANSVFVLARDGDQVVGAATGLPMADETPEFTGPFEQAGWPVGQIFYFGESVLLRAYRGQGIGVSFIEERERHALESGFRYTAFCAVIRPENHPERPADYEPLDDFWRRRGYQPIPGLTTHYAWTDLGDTAESKKPMQFWYRDLQAS